MAQHKLPKERRIAVRCPQCRSKSIKRETTVQGRVTETTLRCASCNRVWTERRHS